MEVCDLDMTLRMSCNSERGSYAPKKLEITRQEEKVKTSCKLNDYKKWFATTMKESIKFLLSFFSYRLFIQYQLVFITLVQILHRLIGRLRPASNIYIYLQASLCALPLLSHHSFTRRPTNRQVSR
jgi:hypothetical protein